jgi:hypothetical protein
MQIRTCGCGESFHFSPMLKNHNSNKLINDFKTLGYKLKTKKKICQILTEDDLKINLSKEYEYGFYTELEGYSLNEDTVCGPTGRRTRMDDRLAY